MILSLFQIGVEIIRSDLVVLWYGELHAAFGAMFSRALGRPTLLILAGFETSSLPDYAYGSQRSLLRKTIVALAVTASTLVVVPSTFMANQARKLYQKADVRIVPLAVEERIFHPGGAKPKTGVLTIVSGGRDLRIKGLDLVIETARNLPNVPFTVVGLGPDSMRRLSQTVPHNLRAVPRVPHETVADYCRAAAVILQPSRDESFGLAVAEGMATGCVPVTSAAGGLPEVVGAEGLVVAQPDSKKLAEAVERAISDRDNFHPTRRAREAFSEDRRARAVAQLMHELTRNAR